MKMVEKAEEQALYTSERKSKLHNHLLNSNNFKIN